MSQIFKIWNTYISPASDEQLDLGSGALHWKDLYLSGIAYLDNVTMGGNLDLNDFSIESIGYLYGISSDDYIRMSQLGRLIINMTGIGTPYLDPDIDITGSVYFDDDIGLAIDKKIMFGDEESYILSDDTDHLDVTSTNIDLNGKVNFTGSTNLMFSEGDLVSYDEEVVFYA
jgi:hypothetical protein